MYLVVMQATSKKNRQTRDHIITSQQQVLTLI